LARDPVSATVASMRFETTNWSVILKATEGESSVAREALATLCQTYWAPIYAFIRSRGQAPTDAEDLTQAYFTRFLDKGYLHDFSPERGRFRTFLRASVSHFLANEWDRQRALKRGGGRAPVSLDGVEEVEGHLRVPVDTVTPEVLFEREWAASVLRRCLERLRREQADSGRFDALKPFLVGDGGPEGYGAVARELGLQESSVRVAVHRLRRRFCEVLREEVGRTVSNPGDVDGEIRWLLSAVRGGEEEG
jgi:RNA polymerase sigma factor (sigma-70 family)